MVAIAAATIAATVIPLGADKAASKLLPAYLADRSDLAARGLVRFILLVILCCGLVLAVLLPLAITFISDEGLF